MAVPDPSANSALEGILVPFSRVAGLVRLLTHDMRNGLNSMDLQTAYLGELVNDPEATAEIKRLRAMIVSNAKILQAISAKFWLPTIHPITYGAAMLVEDFQARFGKAHAESAARVGWEEQLGADEISVDLELIFGALGEGVQNALQFQPSDAAVTVTARAQGADFLFEIRQPHAQISGPPESWGAEPLISTRRGGFGMGLFQARRIVQAHGGSWQFEAEAAEETLLTRIRLPLATPTQ